MIFHENHLPADDSHEISYLIFFKLGQLSQNLSSVAVVIGVIMVLFVCLFDLIFYVPSTIFQLNRDGYSSIEPVLS